MSVTAPSISSASVAAPAGSAAGAKALRLVSLDALRGFDMIWILGADAVGRRLGEVTGVQPFKLIGEQLEHKAWAGLAFYDLIFPLFVFMSGASLVFSLGRTLAEHGRATAVKRVLFRGALIFLLGIFYNRGLTNPWPDVRLMGVLQRIGLAYAAAGVLFCFFRPRVLAGVGAAILVGYWALLTFVPIRDIALDRAAMAAHFAPGQPTREKVAEIFAATTQRVSGRFEPGLNVTNHFDFEHLPGRMYDLYWDPEGILSTFPAVVTCLLGIAAGLLLRRRDLNENQKLGRLVAWGLASLAAGWLWHLQFPVIKKIWTSSYVLASGGWCFLLLATFYYCIDLRGWRRWCVPFVWIGMNPITLYLTKNMLDFGLVAQRLTGGSVKAFFDSAITVGSGDLVIELTALGLVLCLAWFLHRRQIFLRV